jgi:hypothetical protein
VNVIYLGLVLLGCTALLAIAGWLAKVRLVQLEKLERARTSFYRKAITLIEKDQTPQPIIDLLHVLGCQGFRFSKSFQFLAFVVLARLGGLPRKESQNPITLPPALGVQLFAALDSFFLALSYRSLLFGWLFRWAIKPVIDPAGDGDQACQELRLVDRAYNKRRLATAA